MDIFDPMIAVKSAIDAAVQAAKNHDESMAQRHLLTVRKEIEIARLQKEQAEEIHKMDVIHMRRTQIIDWIGHLLVENAKDMTPGILSSAQLLIQMLR